MEQSNKQVFMSLIEDWKNSFKFIGNYWERILGISLIYIGLFFTVSVVFFIGSFCMTALLGSTNFPPALIAVAMVICVPLAVLWFIVLNFILYSLISYLITSHPNEMFFIKDACKAYSHRLKPFAFAILAKWILVGIGAAMLFIPGIIVIALLSMVEILVLIENETAGNAIRRSFKMTTSIFWSFLGFLLVCHGLPSIVFGNSIILEIALVMIYIINMHITYFRISSDSLISSHAPEASDEAVLK